MVQDEPVQLYFCKTCSKRFSDRKLSHTSYPPKLILSALTYYNMGHTLDMTVRTMRRRNKTKIPLSTLRNWINRYGNELPATRLRKKYDLDPNQTIKTRRLFHPQPYLFRVHTHHQMKITEDQIVSHCSKKCPICSKYRTR